MIKPSMVRVVLLLIVCAGLVACGGNRYRPDSPDVRYRSAQEYKKLQLPPDVEGVGQQQYVIPRGGSKISRSSVLPTISTAQFKREGAVSWLEIALTPDVLWPELVAFLDNAGYPLAVNDSSAGLMMTRWAQPIVREARDGILQTVLGDKRTVVDDELLRYALRLEHSEDGASSRLFARVSQYRKRDASEQGDDESNANPWQIIDDDPEQSADLLNRILLWLGIEEQKSNEILSDTEVEEFHHHIHLTANDQRPYLLIWEDYETAFGRVRDAVDEVGFHISDDDVDTGVIEVVADTDYLSEVRAAQEKRREENKGFFSGLASWFGGDEVPGAQLSLRLQRVESQVYAVDVVDRDTGAIENEPGQRVLAAVRDALIQPQ